MSKRIKVVIGVVVLAGAVLVKAGLPTAQASTTACGSGCISLSVQSEGTSEDLTVTGGTSSAYSVGMAAASTTNSGQDFSYQQEAQSVQEAVAAGAVPNALNFNYYNDYLGEFQYTPDGVPSGKCLAEGSTSLTALGISLTLATCGEIGNDTLWILDGQGTNDYIDLINAGYGSGDYFADPGVLTVDSSGQVVISQLSEIGGVVSRGQMWTGFSGA